MTFEISGSVPREVVLNGAPEFFFSATRGGVTAEPGELKFAEDAQALRGLVVVLTPHTAGAEPRALTFFAFN